MYKAYKFRLYPNNNQIFLINKIFGCTRFVYNYYLSQKKNKHLENKTILTSLECIKDLKSNLIKDKTWLTEVDIISLNAAIYDLEVSFNRTIKDKNDYPNFKSKYNSKNSFKTNNFNNKIKLDLKNKVISIKKIGDMNIRGYRKLKELNARMINATISKEMTCKYYISVLVEEKTEPIIVKPSSIVGIDLGIKDLVTTSQGIKYPNIKILEKYEKRIKRMQKKLSNKIKGSNNYYKIKQKLAVIYSKIKNKRINTIHQITNKIIKNNDIIISETLNIKNMVKNHKLAKSIHDVSWREIVRQFEYKCRWLGKKFYQIDTFYPSSQTCSVCNKKNMTLKDIEIREWICDKCQNNHDRDINAAVNIMFEGLKKYIREYI